LAGGTGYQFLSRLDCTGYGSRRVRAVYVSNQSGGYRVCYRCTQGVYPYDWSGPIVISDTQATDVMEPVVTSYGVAGDTLDKGLIFYAGTGPIDLWYDAQQFAGLSEGRVMPGPATVLQAASLVRDELVLRLSLTSPEKLELDLYAIDGRQVCKLPVGRCPAGDRELWIPVPGLTTGSYLLRLRAGHDTSICKVVSVH
jgi:hypothetical protein